MKKLISYLILLAAFSTFAGCQVTVDDETIIDTAPGEEVEETVLEENSDEYDINLDNALTELELVGGED